MTDPQTTTTPLNTQAFVPSKSRQLRSLTAEVLTDLQAIPRERLEAVAREHDTSPATIAAVLRVLSPYVCLQYGDCYPYQSTISLVSGYLSIATIRRTIRALEALGILETLVMSDARAVYGPLHDGRGNAYRLTAYARRRELPLRPGVIVSPATREARRKAGLATRARNFQRAMQRKREASMRERRLRELEAARLANHPIDRAHERPVVRGPRSGVVASVGSCLTPPAAPVSERQPALTVSEITAAEQHVSGSAALAAGFLARLQAAVRVREDKITGGIPPTPSVPPK